MSRRNARSVRAASILGLLLAGSACARQEMPRGGEPDRTPPVVVSVRPEALGRTEALREPIRIQFNERISERPSSGLMNDAVLVSPETGPARVSHRRDALEVAIPGGMRAGLVYRVTVLPVVRDLFGNVMREPFEFVFSTGGELQETAVAGLVVDRVTGRPAPDLRIHAVDEREEEDEPEIVHVARTDTVGMYALRYVPPGRYRLVGFQDRNRNRVPDLFELQGRQTLELGPADTLFLDFPVLEPDTVPIRPSGAEAVEPALVRVTFEGYLDPDEPLDDVRSVLERADGQGGAPAVGRLLHEHRWVELREAELAADSADRAPDPPEPVDTLPPGDTLAPRTPPPTRPSPPRFVGRSQSADTATAALLGLTLPSRVVYAELTDSLVAGVDYVLRMQGVVSLTGVTAGADTVVVSREPPPDPAPEPAPASPDTGTVSAGRPPPGGRREGRPATPPARAAAPALAATPVRDRHGGEVGP